MKVYDMMIMIGIIGAIAGLSFLVATMHSSYVPDGVDNEVYQAIPVGDSGYAENFNCTTYQTGQEINAKCIKTK